MAVRFARKAHATITSPADSDIKIRGIYGLILRQGRLAHDGWLPWSPSGCVLVAFFFRRLVHLQSRFNPSLVRRYEKNAECSHRSSPQKYLVHKISTLLLVNGGPGRQCAASRHPKSCTVKPSLSIREITQAINFHRSSARKDKVSKASYPTFKVP
jgi:hypothetical protein